MPSVEYRLFFDKTPATREQLDRFETITVEQEVDMAWEARIEVPLCLNEQGKWTGDDQRFMTSFERIRIEIRTGKGAFVPLIDGPVVGLDRQLSFEPGQSLVTIVVQDDSVFLNRQDQIQPYEGQPDYKIARQVFKEVESIATTDIDSDEPASADEFPPILQRGTPMEFLRYLAKRWNKHAYVLPGEQIGESIGCFKRFPNLSDRPGLTIKSLLPLIVLSEEANTSTFTVQLQSQKPASFTSYRLNISDKQVLSSTTSFQDRERLGNRAIPAVSDKKEDISFARRILRPDPCQLVEHPDLSTAAAADRSAYAFEASGSVLASCYADVLRPYHLVMVQAGEISVSGAYVITQVTHTLARSYYSQSFKLTRDAVSEKSKERSADPKERIN